MLIDVSDHSLLTQARLDTIAALLYATSGVPGDLAEVGVYRGGSAKVIATIRPDRVLHLFDTFAGMPVDDLFPEGHRQGDFDVKLEDVKSYLDGLNVAFHVGAFPHTAAELPEDAVFSFVHVDGDIYQTTRLAIDYFWPRMAPGGVMVFDDYRWPACPGVARAVDEFFGKVNVTPGDYQCWAKA
jgi:hypothetical protein